MNKWWWWTWEWCSLYSRYLDTPCLTLPGSVQYILRVHGGVLVLLHSHLTGLPLQPPGIVQPLVGHPDVLLIHWVEDLVSDVGWFEGLSIIEVLRLRVDFRLIVSLEFLSPLVENIVVPRQDVCRLQIHRINGKNGIKIHFDLWWFCKSLIKLTEVNRSNGIVWY